MIFFLIEIFKVKRDRQVNSQPNSPSTASPHLKKRITEDPPMTSKELLNSPQRPSAPPGSPRKVETRTRAQIMLEEIVGKKAAGKTLSKELLKKQLEKSGKLNEIKSKLAEVRDIDARLKAEFKKFHRTNFVKFEPNISIFDQNCNF